MSKDKEKKPVDKASLEQSIKDKAAATKSNTIIKK